MDPFVMVYGTAPAATGTAPGRVNLLGGHTDYNDGYVLPAPIPQTTHVSLGPSGDGDHHFYSHTFDARIDCAADAERARGFAAYLLGCIREFERIAGPLPPLEVAVTSRVPPGAGLSSSAALEVAMLRALCRFRGIEMDDRALARMAQRAEIEYAGVRCGIMDQMAAGAGRPDHLLFLDTRTLAYQCIPLPRGAEILVIDSGIPRTLASTGYNRRRRECDEAARALGVKALRDVESVASLAELPEPLARRARHVITENARVLAAAAGVSAEAFGARMNASHQSLSRDFEVSTPRLDTLVKSLQEAEGCFGARMTGAGFGGACVALVARGTAVAIADAVLERYRAAGGDGRRLVPPPDPGATADLPFIA